MSDEKKSDEGALFTLAASNIFRVEIDNVVARALASIESVSLGPEFYLSMIKGVEAMLRTVDVMTKAVAGYAAHLEDMAQRIELRVATMPEEERIEWLRAFEDAPLQPVDVNATEAGEM